MRKFFLILLTAVFGLQAEAQTLTLTQERERIDVKTSKHVYFGIAGPTAGLGQMGHAFLVFASKPKVFLSGHAYQYNNYIDEVLMKQGIDEVAARFLEGTLPAVFTREDALGFIETYTAENRLITLYPLKMTAKQVQELQARLEDEYMARKDESKRDYDFLHKNCLTELIDHVNAVLEGGKQFPNPSGAMRMDNMFYPETYTANIPLSFEKTLQDSELVDQEGVEQLMPNSTLQAKANMEMIPWLKKVVAGCAWAPQKAEIVRSYLINNKTRYTVAFQKYLAKEIKACKSLNAGDRDLFLDLLSYDLDYYSNLPSEKRSALQNVISSARD